MRYLLGEAADQFRHLAPDAGAPPVIPGRRNRKRTICYDKDRYRGPPPHRERVLPPQGLLRVHTFYD